MANAYSIVNTYNEPIYTPNFALIQQVLNYKQQKLDQNRAALQDYYDDTITSLSVLKDVDQNYINNRVEQVTDLVNQYANQDLSSPGLFQALQRDITKIVDPTVKKAVLSTAMYKKDQESWQKALEEKPELVNDVNFQYAQQRANAWLANSNPGASYTGGGGFIPLYDFNQKDVQKNLPSYLKDFGIEKRTEILPSGMSSEYFVKEGTNERISKLRVLQGLRGVMSRQGYKQMGIDAWGRYRSLDESNLLFEAKNRVSNIEKVINNLESQTSVQNLTSFQKNQLDEEISYQKQRKANLLSSLNNGQFDRSSIEFALENDSYEDRVVNQFSYNREIDSKIKDYNLQRDKLKLSIKKYQHQVNKASKKQQEEDSKIDIQRLGDANLQPINIQTDPEGSLNPFIETGVEDFDKALKDIIKYKNIVGNELLDKDISKYSDIELDTFFNNINEKQLEGNLNPEELSAIYNLKRAQSRNDIIRGEFKEAAKIMTDQYIGAIKPPP